MADEEDKPIRVVDRRMFTPEGDLRPDYQAPEESPPETAAKPTPSAAVPPPAPPEAAGRRAGARGRGRSAPGRAGRRLRPARPDAGHAGLCLARARAGSGDRPTARG